MIHLSVACVIDRLFRSWYGYHLVQTKSPLEKYMKEIRAWLDDHKSEIVVMMVSNHGQPCVGYPGIDGESDKQKLANIFLENFGDLLMDR